MSQGTGLSGRWAAPTFAGLVVFLVDQLTKWWVLQALKDQDVDLFWTLRFHLVRNTGAAFSQGEGLGPLLAVAAVVVVILVVRYGAKTVDPVARAAVGAVVGGALANLGDRAFRADEGLLSGAVIDFVDFQWWPVFNVADAAIVVGGILIVLRGWSRG
ncbi:MAG: signal peptidase II [Acidimicrobiales bacterium]|nr:signal peptidase II [Acidimicrobiales bacterium]